MAITENLQGTRSGSIDASGSRTVKRNFTVTGTDVLQTAIAEMDAHVKYLNTYEVGTNVITGDAVLATYYGTKSWSRPEGTDETWSFEITYSTAPSAGDGATGADAVITTQGDTRATIKSVYRSGDVQTDNVDNPNASDDIEGDPIDQGGIPTSIISVDRNFSVTERVVYFPLVGVLSGLVGKRNSGMYEGGIEGTILYLGFSWNYDTSSGLWVIDHQFAVDERTHHAEQVAKTDPQGDIIKEHVNIGGEEIYFAKHVYWVQPFIQASFDVLPSF
jgi:hypothetical protein